MKKFGFRRDKDKSEGDDESQRSALFGSRKKDKPEKEKTVPASINPYAQPQTQPDPYAARPSANGPPPYEGGMSNQLRQEKSPVPPGGYGGAPSSSRFQAQGSHGNQSGYGSDRYGPGGGASPHGSRGPAGYGGLGRASSNETMSTEAGREELFGGARRRFQQQQQAPASGRPEDSGQGDNDGAGSQSYGAYGDRQLTAEEEEEEDVQATKQQIKSIKQQDVSSTRNALRIAAQAEETGRETLARLGAQGERIHNTERNLDLASNQNRLAEEKARELKTLNRSMFAMHVSNPFTASSRREARDAAVMEKHRSEREQRDATRAAAYGSQTRQGEIARDLRGNPIVQAPNKQSLAERSKYQFEADSEDDEMENEIDSNLDALHGAAGRLKGLAGAMGREVDEQNKHINRIINKTDKVDDQIAMNRARLDRIR